MTLGKSLDFKLQPFHSIVHMHNCFTCLSNSVTANPRKWWRIRNFILFETFKHIINNNLMYVQLGICWTVE